MDLKRNLWARERNETGLSDLRPLFEKYQFLSPGMSPFSLPLFNLHLRMHLISKFGF